MKIIYLDQFVLQNAFCPSPQDLHRDFFVQMGKLCMKLAEKRVVAFPFSESHLRETALQTDKAKSEAIAESFAAISNGYQFCPAQGILELQARAVRKGLPIDWSANRVVFHDNRFGFRKKLSATIIPDRALHHAKFKQVLLQFQNATDAKLDGIAKREAQASDQLESLIRRALDRIMAVPREGCHVSMRVNYSLTNCAGMEVKSHSGSQSKKIESDLFGFGVSDWLTDGRNLLWPKPDEILTALFQSKSLKPRAKGRRISAALSGLG